MVHEVRPEESGIDRTPFVDASRQLELPHVLATVAEYCATALGQELMHALTPSSVYAEVRDDLLLVSEMRDALVREDPPPIHPIDDIRATLHRMAIEGSMVQADEFRSVLTMMTASRILKTYLQKREERFPLTAQQIDLLYADKMMEFHIDRVVDEEGNVKDHASKELRRIRQELISRSEVLRRRMDAILKRVAAEGIVQEELVTLRDGRMVLPVKAEWKRQVQGFIHSASATGQTVYIEPAETLELNNEIRDLQFDEMREIARILAELTQRVRPAIPHLVVALSTYALLDATLAKARYGQASLCTIPDVVTDGLFRIDQARHPGLLMRKSFESIVPLDILIGDPETTIVITGPNAGGKSVAMKTVGLLSLMVQCGIPVPCAEGSRFRIFSDILVDIGDEQSVENDLSTFSAHMRRLVAIAERASSRTLILIDEIGTGTDPAEGSALAAALLRHVTERGAVVIATTHHGMLKAFAHSHPAMMNAAMEFDTVSLQPTYRFRAGLPGSSYAFEISRRLGMPAEILDAARDLLGSQADSLEHLLAEVARTSQHLGVTLRKAELQKEEYEERVREYEAKMKAAKQEVRLLKKDALEEARRIVEDANVQVEAVIQEIRESQAEKEKTKQVRAEMRETREAILAKMCEVSEEPIAPPEEVRDWQVGDAVLSVDHPGIIGTVTEAAKEGMVAVVFGIMKMRVSVSTLRPAAPLPQSGPVESLPEEVSSKIDIRGMYGDEAVRELDSWLYAAYLAGLRQVEIIHGKGTGALRTRVHTFLRTIPFVSQFSLGQWNDGGSGKTTVEFHRS